MKKIPALKVWLAEVIVEHPEIMLSAKSATAFYAQFYEIWCIDIQVAAKELFTDIKNEIK